MFSIYLRFLKLAAKPCGMKLKSLAASAAALWPFDTMRTISDCCCRENFGLRLPISTICIIIRPAAAVVSMASVKLRNPALASPSLSLIMSTSRRERESRSSFQTVRTSPFRS